LINVVTSPKQKDKMLPDFLYDSYKQYKKDTDSIASWLATTAKGCGYFVKPLGNVVETSQPSIRLKGKARKLAKDSHKAAPHDATISSNSTAHKAHQYIIARKEFVPLAEHVAAATKPPIAVPSTFVTTLTRAISLRKERSRWLCRYQEVECPEADESHDHFVDVLEKVYSTLKPRFQRAPRPVPISHGRSNSDITNVFAQLHLDQPSEAFINAPSAVSTTIPKETYTAEPSRTVQEMYLAFHCLLEDLEVLRKYLKQIWSGYAWGISDLTACSVTATVAIDIARRSTQSFINEFGDLFDYFRVANDFLAMEYMHKGLDTSKPHPQGDPYNFEASSMADFMYLSTFIILNTFKEVIHHDTPPAARAKFRISSNWASLSARDRFEEDTHLVMSTFTDFILLKGAVHITAPDRVAEAVQLISVEQKTEVWALFACQVWLDAFHCLQERYGTAHTEVQQHAVKLIGTLQEQLGYREGSRPKTWPRTADEDIDKIVKSFDNTIVQDYMSEFFLRMVSQR
jgi:hypothetical protein